MRGALEKMAGVAAVNITAGDSSEFSVDYDPDKVKPAAILAALHAAGEKETTLKN